MAVANDENEGGGETSDRVNNIVKVLNDTADEYQMPTNVHDSDDEAPEKEVARKSKRKVKFEQYNKSPTRSPAKVVKAHLKSKPRGSSLQKRYNSLEDNVRMKNIEISDLNRQLKAANELFNK